MSEDKMDCRNFDELYWLKAYGEPIPGGEEGWRRHLETCQRCQTRQAELNRLHALLSFREAAAPKPEALLDARRRLLAQIRTTEKKNWTLNVWHWLWGRRLHWEIGLATAALVMGLMVGRYVSLRPAQPFWSPNLTPVSQSVADWQDQTSLERLFIAQNLIKEKSKISDLKVKSVPDQDSTIEVRFKAAKEYSIQGRPDDPVILELLGWAVKNADNSGVRLQSVEELARASALSEKARQALAYALVNDQNSGVRLRALEALRGGTSDELTEQAILNALLKDPNPAVRIGAIDALIQSEPNYRTENMLLYAAESDSNEYVRLQARRAIRESTGNYQMLDDRNRHQGEYHPEELIQGEAK